MGTDEDLEATVTVGGKKYPLNYHEMEVQFEEKIGRASCRERV